MDASTLFVAFVLLIAALWAVTRFWLAGEDLSRHDARLPAQAAPGAPDPALAEILALLGGIAGAQEGLPFRQRLAVLRERIDAFGEGVPLEGIELRPVQVAGQPAEWVLADGADPGRRLLYLHGGAFALGSPRSHRAITTELSRRARCAVLAIEYRLMPEHRRLEGLADCQAAYRWILENGPAGTGAPDALFVAGDSAGGNLTLAVIAWARDAGLRAADAAVALSPATDSTLSSPSIVGNLESDWMLGPQFGVVAKLPRALVLWVAWALSRVRPCDPRVSPAHGELHGLPPVLVHASEAEMLLDDARRYCAKARAAGSPVELQTWPGMVHVWHLFHDRLPQAREAMDAIVRFLEAHAPQRAR